MTGIRPTKELTMRSIKEQLQPNEEILYVARLSRISLNIAVILLVVIFLAAIVIWSRTANMMTWIVAGALALPLLFTIINHWIAIATNLYVLTNRRVLKQTGIISKHSGSSYLDKINNVEHRQTMWGRMLNYGDVEIDTASETGTTTFRGIERPITFQKKILAASEELRNRGYAPAAAAAPSPARQIRDLKALLDEGLISQEEYEAKRKELLSEM